MRVSSATNRYSRATNLFASLCPRFINNLFSQLSSHYCCNMRLYFKVNTDYSNVVGLCVVLETTGPARL